MRLGILISGAGSNMMALVEAHAAGRLGGAVPRVVIANRPDAPGLARARAAGVEAVCIDHASFTERARFEQVLVDALRARSVELVALAGFMRVLGPAFLNAFENRVVNIHPALLPSFPGMHAQRQALAHGVKVAGCTVHFVDAGVDTGPIIAQAAVEVRDDDDEATLSQRILAVEHKLYPEAIRAIAEGRVARDGRRVRVSPARPVR